MRVQKRVGIRQYHNAGAASVSNTVPLQSSCPLRIANPRSSDERRLNSRRPTSDAYSTALGKLHPRMHPETQSVQDEEFRREQDQLCATARACYARGWAPATSGNFSARSGEHIFITPTGLDKGTLTPADLLEIDLDGSAISGSGQPSAETSLHTVIYRHRLHAGAILHVHSIWNTLLSGRFLSAGHVSLRGYELLKGLSGVSTHDHIERVPIIENAQDYVLLADQLGNVLHANSEAHGVLLSRHGLYTWGASVAEARRHMEALEFLFEVEGRQLFGQQG